MSVEVAINYTNIKKAEIEYWEIRLYNIQTTRHN